MPHVDIGRFAHLWSTQRFGLFWGCYIHNPSGKTNLRAEFDYPHPLDAQAFELFGASISTRHPNSRGCSRTESHRPIDSRKAPTDKAFRSIRLIEGRTLTGQVHRDSTGWCAGCPHAGQKRGGYSARDRVAENVRSTAFRPIVPSRIRIGLSRSGFAGIRTQLAIQTHAHRQDAQRFGLFSCSVIHTGLSRQCCSTTYCSGPRHAIERYPRRTTPISR